MRMGTYLVVKRMCCAPAAMLRCAVHSTVVLCRCCPLRCSAVMVEFPLAAVMEAIYILYLYKNHVHVK
jgi:hypothetical protein